MAGQRVVKRAHSNCEDEAIKENPVKRFFATKIAVNATGWIDPLKDHLSTRMISSSCKMYISTFYKILSASGGLQILLSGSKIFWVLDFLPFFVRDFEFPWFLPSIRADLALSFSSFFSSSVFYYWVPPSWVRHPHHHHRHPIQAQAALKVLEKYWSCICVFLNFPRPLYPLTSRRSVDVEAPQKAVPIGRLKELHCFFITFIAC